MKSKIFLLVLFLLATKDTTAQIMFERIYGGVDADWGVSVQSTSDSGYIATGGSFSYGDGSNDVYLLKTDKYGNELWHKTYGGNGYDIGIAVKQTMDGGYIITGSTSSYGAGSSDVYLIRTDALGDTLWTRTFGGAEDDAGYSVIENNDGSLLIVGNTLSFAVGFSAAYVIKTDENGNLLWQKSYEKSGTSRAGGVHKINNEGYIIAGSTYSLGTSHKMFYFLKINENGDTIWTKTYSIPNCNVGTGCVDITADSGFVFGGSITYSNGDADLCLMKTDTNGNFLWFKKYSGTGAQMGGNFCQTNDGCFVITGMTGDIGKDNNTSDLITESIIFNNLNPKIENGNLIILKTNSSGDSLWSRTYGNNNNDFGNSIQLTIDNGFIICGGKTTGSNQDLYLVKTDNLGLTGITDDYANEMNYKLYPNPSNGVFQIQSAAYCISDVKVNVMNYSGQIILNKIIDLNERNKIDLTTCGNGLYFIQFIYRNGETFSRKVIVQH